MTSLTLHAPNRSGPVETLASWRAVIDERLLWSVVLCVFVLDLATTAFGLSVGLSELNPIAASLLATHGIASLVVVKSAVLAVGVLCYSIVPDRHGILVPLGLALPWGLAVVVNSLAIVVAS